MYDFPVVFSILPNSLTVGRSYTFKLEASYDSTFGSEYIGVGEFSTVINEPPTGGQLRVSPIVGETLSVDFVVKTYDWIDSIEDYPLVYFMSSYLLSPDEYTLLKAYSEVSLVKTVLGVGNQSLSVYAKDIYGSTSSTTQTVSVTPLRSLTDAKNKVNVLLDEALSTGDYGGVSTIVDAALDTANVADCSSIVTACDQLNRRDCDMVPNTCGPCKNGYAGVSG